MVEFLGWIRRHLKYPHEPKPRNVLVTFNGDQVLWRTKKEAEQMIADGTANFVTPQGGKTIRYVEIEKVDEDPDLDS